MTECVAYKLDRSGKFLLLAAGWMAISMPVFGQIFQASGPRPSQDAPSSSTPAAASAPATASDAATLHDLPRFEVATIKPGRHVTVNAERLSADGYQAKDATVYDLIEYAYNLPWGVDGLISGGPTWTRSATFDINAKAEKPMPIEHGTPTGLPQMLQALLADRFKLKVHYESKEIPVYALTIARGGPKLKSWVAPATPPADSASADSPGAHMRLTRGDMWAQHVPTDWLAGYLQFQPEIGRTVIDKTGLTGKYDIALKWSPEGMQGSELPKSNADLPDLFTALVEQLGLKLEMTRGPTETIVIDHVEMPSAN